MTKQTSERLLSLGILLGITIASVILVNNPGSLEFVILFVTVIGLSEIFCTKEKSI